MVEIAQLSDLEEINRIYNQGITLKTNAYDKPLSLEEQRNWFTVHENSLYPVLVARSESGLKAWLSISPYRKGRKTLARTAEISYYVDQDYYRQGLATTLIQAAEDFGVKNGLLVFFAITLAYNKKSNQLLEKLGYAQWGFLPNVAVINNALVGQYYYGKQLQNAPFEVYTES